ncbi:hypothetical protein D3C77_708790 [compost metagenome]
MTLETNQLIFNALDVIIVNPQSKLFSIVIQIGNFCNKLITLNFEVYTFPY